MKRLEIDLHPLLTADIIKALNSHQIFTVVSFISKDTQTILKITRLTFREILNIKKLLLNKFAPRPTKALDAYQSICKNAAIIPTGIKSCDSLLLGGGLFTGNIYEICGLPASGKTQFALTLVKNALALSIKHHIYYLDTKNDFSGRRMSSILGSEDVTLLNKILVKRINTRDHLIASLMDIKRQLTRQDDIGSSIQLRMIIIDSLPPLVLNSQDHIENNSFLNRFANLMRYIAVEHCIVFVVVNLITTWTEGDFNNLQVGMVNERPACGKYWLGIPNTRLRIEKNCINDGDSNKCRISVLKSDHHPPESSVASVDVLITKAGIL